MTREEYEEMINLRPNLKPSEVLKVARNIVQEYKFSHVHGVSFTIPGQPMGKPRMTQQDKWKKRPVVQKYWKWCAHARSHASRSLLSVGASISQITQIHMVAYLEFPKSYSKKKRASLAGKPHLVKPDRNNIMKGLEDALFENDSQLWKSSEEKRWDDGKGPRIEVELR